MTDFSKATERPWKVRRSNDLSGDVGITADGLPNVLAETFAAIRDRNERSVDEASANAALIVAAVNAFDPEREKKVEALVEAIEEVIAATGAYLPPDGISPQECLNRILGATDNKKIVDALHSLKGGENG
jgi:hypothetical protein